MDKPHILVVEDNNLLLQAIRDLLEMEGYRVTTAINGEHALKILETALPDLILSDIMMPKVTGYMLYEKVRENPAWVRIPFIFLTAKGEREDILKGKALGVEDYLTKPFDTQELIVAIRARLGRAQAIQKATETEFDGLKQQIINMLSHELRTPLTYISGYTELALEDISTLSPQELQEFLIGIKHGADRLNALVTDLLLVVQLDSGRTKEEFAQFSRVSKDLDRVIARTVQRHTAMAAGRGVVLELDLPEQLPPVRIYDNFVIDILSRLINNAIKFSREPAKGRCVTVSAHTAEDWVVIAVRDEGVGIPEEGLEHIFERFRQINRERMEQQGTGLGLSITQALVQIHGGRISAQSKVGVGSTFTIELPVVKEV